MPTTLKVKRSGSFTSHKKKPFRAWLDSQLRSALTYRKDVPDREGIGWKTEEFAEEARKRGVDVRIGTTFAWCSGAQPRYIAHAALVKAFPGITF